MPDDDALMLAYAAGDADAFEQLYARHQAGLYRYLRRLLGSGLSHQIDEVFQDTWLRVVQSRGGWTPHRAGDPRSASFRTWLYTLAHHRAIDQWRRSGREVSMDVEGDAPPWEPADAGPAWQAWPVPPADGPGAEDTAFWRRAGERLLACLEELPLPQRSAFLLHHDDGLPLDEVATAVGSGFETVKTRLRYAMSKLRTCMGAYLSPREGGWA